MRHNSVQKVQRLIFCAHYIQRFVPFLLYDRRYFFYGKIFRHTFVLAGRYFFVRKGYAGAVSLIRGIIFYAVFGKSGFYVAGAYCGDVYAVRLKLHTQAVAEHGQARL